MPPGESLVVRPPLSPFFIVLSKAIDLPGSALLGLLSFSTSRSAPKSPPGAVLHRPLTLLDPWTREGPRSRITQASALGTLALLLGGSREDAAVIPWQQIDYQHSQAIRAKLLERLTAGEYAPASSLWPQL